VVVGADGVRSWTRRALGVQLETRSIGMGIWRAFGPRPASVTRTDLYYGGPSFIAGYCPTGQDSLYAYIVEPAQDRSGLSPDEQLATMKQLSQAYHGPWDEIRETLTDPSRVNYTWFETHVLEEPWNRGRVVLIGDAAHTCPPTIAQGGAMALEDAVVLAELLTERQTLDQELWDAFTARRYERAKTVVDASNTLAQWQVEHVRGDIPGLMRSIAELTSQPA
jgi:2-polyprenyl-6-methoxyphenol hydroxylase-like FAD-dependent oxidoreductase